MIGITFAGDEFSRFRLAAIRHLHCLLESRNRNTLTILLGVFRVQFSNLLGIALLNDFAAKLHAWS